MKRIVVVGLVAAFACFGCMDREPGPVCPVPTELNQSEVLIGGFEGVDMLVVVDNSGSMAEEQSNLAANFPAFIQQLEEYRTPNGTPLDYRVGVTSVSRSGLVLSGSMTVKMGDGACTPGGTCSNASHTCECPGLNFIGCAEDCPGDCFCEPAGQRMPIPQENCRWEEGALVRPTGYETTWIQGPGEHVAAAFSDAATLGTGGCSLEMPLYAVEHALSTEFQSAPGGPNEGFLRPDALLTLIIITDEDDCSANISEFRADIVMDMNHPLAGASTDLGCTDATGAENGEAEWIPLEHYVEFLDTLMGVRTHWAVGVIAGQTSCESAFGNAYTAHRLGRFVDMVGGNAVFSDICAGDLATALGQVLQTLQVACDQYVLI